MLLVMVVQAPPKVHRVHSRPEYFIRESLRNPMATQRIPDVVLFAEAIQKLRKKWDIL